MDIYKIKTDTNNVQLLALSNPEEQTLNNLRFDARPRKQDWKKPKTYIFNPTVSPKNFFALPVAALVFDKVALNVFQNVFEMAGEILELEQEQGPDIYLLNVLDCMNALDTNKTTWQITADGVRSRILNYAFHKERALNESTLFKIPETSHVDIFCFSGIKHKADEFYSLYHEHGMSGLVFEKIKIDE